MIKRNDHIFAEMNQWAVQNNPDYQMGGEMNKEFDNVFELLISEIHQRYGERLRILSKINLF